MNLPTPLAGVLASVKRLFVPANTPRDELRHTLALGGAFVAAALVVCGILYGRFYYRFDTPANATADDPFAETDTLANAYDKQGRLIRSGLYEETPLGERVLLGYYEYSYDLTAEEREKGICRTARLTDLNGNPLGTAEYYDDCVLVEYLDQKGRVGRLVTYDASLKTLLGSQEFTYEKKTDRLIAVLYRGAEGKVTQKICYAFHDDGKLASVTTYGETGTEVSCEEYYYNGDGWRTLVRTYGPGHIALGYVSAFFREDGVLRYESHYRSDATLLFNRIYQFDAAGNPLGTYRDYDAAGQPIGEQGDTSSKATSSKDTSFKATSSKDTSSKATSSKAASSKVTSSEKTSSAAASSQTVSSGNPSSAVTASQE